MPENIGNIDKYVDTKKNIITGPYKKEKRERMRKFRTKASRLVSMANKRLVRLEENELTDSPAYEKLVGDDGEKPRFSIRGKDYNEVQREVAKMNRFLNAQTSTIRGANRVLKEMAKNTGIKYKNLKELRSKASQFFELASKVEQYLRTVDDMASAIGYQKIWEAVNNYVKDSSREIEGAQKSIEQMTSEIAEAIKEAKKKEYIISNDNMVTGWFRLSDDD